MLVLSPRSRKELLLYYSSRSNLVRRAMTSVCLDSALQKLCAHMMQVRVENQLQRLLSAGFPLSAVHAVVETLSEKLKGSKPRTNAQQRNDK